MKHLAVLISLVALLAACQTPGEKEPTPELIQKHDMQLSNEKMTPEVLWSFGRISGVEIAPDQTKMLYGVSYYSVEANSSNRELFVMNTDGTNKQQITQTPEGEYNAVWRPDGQKIGFMSAASGSMQLWEMNPDGSERTQISEVEGGITGFKYAPDQSKILYTKEVKLVEQVQDIHPDLDKANARILTDHMYRHWDHWVESYSHIFIADYDGQSLSNATDIMEGQPYNSPLKPFGGMEQINWSPGSDKVAFTMKPKTGVEYTVSTNSDIFVYDLNSGETENITEGMMGYDVAPVYSPNGQLLAWESMRRDGYESDQNRLFVMDLATGQKKDYTAAFDQNVHSLSWAENSQTIYFTSDWHATYQIYSLQVPSGEITMLTDGVHNYRSVAPASNMLIATRQSMTVPTEIFRIGLTAEKTAVTRETPYGNKFSLHEAINEAEQISFENKHLLDQLTLGKIEKRWIKTTDNKDMLTWVIYPPNFDESKKYPTLLYCQGGPQSAVSQFYSYRWNFQMMAANDYIIVAPNRRGLPSFGQEWNEQISGDYGGQNMKDYFSAIDAVAQEPYVDNDNLGAVGASYGGFSVLWIAGNHEGRFDALIAHDGIFNLEAQYTETDEMWFANWDLGGPYWDKDNATAQRSFANSPHKFVQNWDTPLMVIHGEKDYRIVASQSMAAFNAALLQGIPAKYLYFPEENHWVLSPQNGVLWQREFFKWLDKWLKDEE